MTKEEAVYILSLYQNANKKSDLMLDKIHKLEVAIYSAQAGFVENEAGVHVSGGSHISRAEKIASLVDLKDKYAVKYEMAEGMCEKILSLIELIYTYRMPKQELEPATELLKLQKYERILIEYYINGHTLEQIGKKDGYSKRQTIRTKNAAVDAFHDLFKNNDYSNTLKYVTGDAYACAEGK